MFKLIKKLGHDNNVGSEIYGVYDTDDETLEYVSARILSLLLKKGIEVQGVSVVDGKLHCVPVKEEFLIILADEGGHTNKYKIETSKFGYIGYFMLRKRGFDESVCDVRIDRQVLLRNPSFIEAVVEFCVFNNGVYKVTFVVDKSLIEAFRQGLENRNIHNCIVKELER